jgi:uncharacterized membrane protein (UPF0127 family)
MSGPIIDLDRTSVIVARADIAASHWQKFWGLMGRASLAEDLGLWFPGANSIHMMFMRFPIDVLFLGDRDPAGARPVIELRVSLRPWRGVVWLARGARACLELPAGTITRAGVQVGDRVRFEGDPG